MKRIPFYTLLLLFCFFHNTVYATHIIGGEMTYVCLGDTPGTPGFKSYEITMKVYRDCTSNTNFDAQAYIAIYRGNVPPYSFVDQRNVGFGTTDQQLNPDTGPCLAAPPDICVREATYTFIIDLEVLNESYQIIYQRCCRNNTISNIFNPGDTGATYNVEINSFAQQECNNTPVYDNFPPIVICAGEPLNFNHGATDVDGDQLVYEFCAPLKGGGQDGGPSNPIGDAAGCNGIRPNPPCPPPFEEVDFQVPTYDAINPLGGTPAVTIDPNTGIITGTPNTLGQFVVGVCVSEFRNGQLIGQVRRDFQFNVENCTPFLDVVIQSDQTLGDDQFLINSCGDPVIDFVNQSSQQNVTDFYWIFDINGSIDTFFAWSPSIDFQNPGFYEGSLILNPESICEESAEVFVEIFPAPVANFGFEYDTCIAGPVVFFDSSMVDNGLLETWTWDFAGQGISSEMEPSFSFTEPGNFAVSLTVVDSNACEAEFTRMINWFPAPPILVVDPNTFSGCPPLNIKFVNLSTPIDTTYLIEWNFGDQTTADSLNPEHLYTEIGTYDISLSITSPIGCEIDTLFKNWITVREPPEANFTFEPQRPNNFSPDVNFIDQSVDAVGWYWDFAESGLSYTQNPEYTFRDTGLQAVRLIATNIYGCSDTTFQMVDVEPHIRYFLPNAFTPNEDALNELFQPAGFFRGINNYEMNIWNRAGELIFASTDPNGAWNGRKNNSGRLAPNGIYVYYVKFNGPRGKPYEFKGYATLIR
ncbi:MAG: PKD domain-containing protein [Saprospiraceae bacterium]